ncbi:hypothetical protein KI809_20305, partial [Geobacter pelophilus]|nr:hypothetical protein [Geoanaerobacter pelophilus]
TATGLSSQADQLINSIGFFKLDMADVRGNQRQPQLQSQPHPVEKAKPKQLVANAPKKMTVNDSGFGLNLGKDHLDTEFEKY